MMIESQKKALPRKSAWGGGFFPYLVFYSKSPKFSTRRAKLDKVSQPVLVTEFPRYLEKIKKVKEFTRIPTFPKGR